MACLGLTERNRQYHCCRNYATNDSFFCISHQNLNLQVLKKRWFHRYLRAGLFSYTGELRAEHVLAPLRAGLFTLTPDDIRKIQPNRASIFDTYLLLLREGYVQPQDNPLLFTMFVKFYLMVNSLANGAHPLWTMTRQVLFNTSQELFEQSIEVILSLSSSTTPANHRAYALHPQTQVLLREILETEVGSKWCWTNPQARLEKCIESEPTPAPELVDFMRTTFFPLAKDTYKQQKEIQKARMDYCKEEIMMVTCHPDRKNLFQWIMDLEELKEMKEMFPDV